MYIYINVDQYINVYIYIYIKMCERKMLREKCVILCYVVLYAVHCFGIKVKKIVGCSSNFVMMMLYYIDMCVFFVCSRLCCFSLLCDFVDQIT